MNKIKNKNGFTLVELIIVITILSVLSTIAFVSFQGFTRDSRNAKRNAELTNLEKQIELSLTQGMSLFSMVKGTGSTITSLSGNVLRIGGLDGYDALSGSYIAGDINNATLGIDANKFIDPLALVPYKIGVTTHGKRYQLAATLENALGGDTLIKGNYFPRTSARNRVDLDSTLNNTGSTVLNMKGGISFIESGLLLGDVVEVSNTGSYTIVGISGNNVFISPALISKGQNLYLKGDEKNLIKRWGGIGGISVGEATNDYTPYKFN